MKIINLLDSLRLRSAALGGLYAVEAASEMSCCLTRCGVSPTAAARYSSWWPVTACPSTCLTLNT